MPVCGAILATVSILFYIFWQYIESLWLIFAYIFTVFSVCTTSVLLEKRKDRRILERLEAILVGKSADCVIDDNLTPTERRLILHLTQLEAREEKIKKSYNNISSLVADIAHQSKTPLSSILMYTELMNAKEQGRSAAVIQAQTEKLKFLMESLTKLAKCESGLIDENLTPKENYVRELLIQAINEHYLASCTKNIEIRCDIPDNLTAVFDVRWTAEAVGNIIDNAVKYSPENSEITVTALEYDMFIRIDVSDQGKAIPEEELTNIWKRFYRGKNAQTKSGAGIGLYLTSVILNAEGGCASAKSNDSGNTFTVYLKKN